jgi:hypothetical protein
MGNYFAAEGIPLLRGRTFTDSRHAPILRWWRSSTERWRNAIGPARTRLASASKIGVKESQTPWMTVVGEIADIKQTSAESETLNQMYSPASQFKASIAGFAPPDMLTGTYGSIVVRGQLPPEQMAETLLRAIVRSIDPQLPLIHVESMEHVVEEGQASRRFSTAVISSFAAAAVLLALLGIYSVIAFSARSARMNLRSAWR